MKHVRGAALPLGVTISEEKINFSVAAAPDSVCELCLYKKGHTEPFSVCELEQEPLIGNVRFAAAEGLGGDIEYLYRIDGEEYLDPYAREVSVVKGQRRGRVVQELYDWEKDAPLMIPQHEVVAYSLHVKGFTRQSASGVRHKGTFAGLVEKIPYLVGLGINQIHCMPVYEFDNGGKNGVNYWGYGPGYFFAPKSSYAAGEHPVTELKDMIKACHKAGIEVILEMPFDASAGRQMMEECLRYYRMEYHVDGFIVNPVFFSAEELAKDPILSRTKILIHSNDYQNIMRRFLKGDEGMVNDVMYWVNHHTEHSYNYITNQNGFTLNDLVSYDRKHNEENGENNQDGPEYNYSWNCGAEGPSRKKVVMGLRKKQMTNALLLLFSAQGTPCILAGDEFANSQKGNNNVYCQDNVTGWVDWSRAKRYGWLTELVKDLISFRKAQPVLTQAEPLMGADLAKCGIPDISFHGEHAWRIPNEVSSRQLGVYYSGQAKGASDCFAIYNMHWVEHIFALPTLTSKRKWYLAASTKEGVLKEPLLLDNQHDIQVEDRTVMILISQQVG